MKSWMYFSPFGTPLLKTWMLVIIPVFWMVSLYIFTSTTTGRWSRVKLWKRVKIQGLNTSSLLAFAEGIPVKEPKKKLYNSSIDWPFLMDFPLGRYPLMN
jgi:hypothetical protein